jgi:hypothetical protein
VSGEWIVLDYDQPGFSPPRTLSSQRWLPQYAWLVGTVLVVERGNALRQCDLATASEVTLRAGWLDGVLVLSAREGTSEDPPVRLAIKFERRGRLLVSPDALRLLAEAIGPRLGRSAHVARDLRDMAGREERRNAPID